MEATIFKTRCEILIKYMLPVFIVFSSCSQKEGKSLALWSTTYTLKVPPFNPPCGEIPDINEPINAVYTITSNKLLDAYDVIVEKTGDSVEPVKSVTRIDTVDQQIGEPQYVYECQGRRHLNINYKRKQPDLDPYIRSAKVFFANTELAYMENGKYILLKKYKDFKRYFLKTTGLKFSHSIQKYDIDSL